MTVEVVVVEPAPESQGSVPIAVAEAVTPGELAARLDLLESRLDERISDVHMTAIDAAVTADQAQETAEVAAIIAVVAEEQAQSPEPVAEEEAEEVGEGADSGTDETEAEGVRPPERRTENASQSQDSGKAQSPKKARGYGAGWLSGGR